jgi:eukaryotic-like serine/threonine-protein kinase
MGLLPGTKLGQYEIIAAIGAGGMGEVYSARDTSLGRDVAVKVLRAGTQHDPDRVRRFRLEAQSAAALNHPNIVAVYFVGEHDTNSYVVSELLEGETLRERLGKGALPTRKCIEYARQIAEGLAAAHAKGIIHRYLKPENIFLTKDGHAKILDFGLAKLTRFAGESAADLDEATLSLGSSPGAILGTVGYMSPEQVRGNPVDTRSDIFSFGVILYEMLSGKNAFRQTSAADTMSAILTADPPDLVASTGSVSPALDRVVRRCLEKDPADRFQSIRDVGFALQALEGSGSTSPPPASDSPIRDKHWPRRIIAIVAALLAIAAAYTIGRHFSASTISRLPQFQRLTFRQGTLRTARFAPDGQTIVYGASFDGNASRIFTTRPTSPESLSLEFPSTNLLAVSRSGELAVSVDCRGFSNAICVGTLARMSLSGGAPREVTNRVIAADWLPSGTELAVARQENGRSVVEFPFGNVVFRSSGWVSSIRVSPSGNLIAIADHSHQDDDSGNVLILDSQGRQKLSAGPFNSLQGLAWTPNGNEVWFAASTGTGSWADQIRAVDLSGKQRTLLPLPGITRLHDISPDGRVLLSKEDWRASLAFFGVNDAKERNLSWLDYSGLTDLSRDGSTVIFTEGGASSAATFFLYLRKTDGSPALKLGEGQNGAISPDGKWVLAATSGNPERLVLYPTGAGETRYLGDSSFLEYGSLGWSPDGSWITFSAHQGHGSRIYRQSVQGGKPQPVTPEIYPGPGANNTSPDGKFVFAIDLQNKPWLYPLDGSQPKPIAGFRSEDAWLNWGADNRTAYITSSQGFPMRIFRLDLITGEKKLFKEFMPEDRTGLGNAYGVLVSQDGRYIAYTYQRCLSELYLTTNLK